MQNILKPALLMVNVFSFQYRLISLFLMVAYYSIIIGSLI